MTIRTKLILWYSGLLASIIIVFSVIVFVFMRWTLVDAIDQTLAETASQVVSNSRAFPVGEFAPPSGVHVRLPSLDSFRSDGVLVQFWDVSGAEPTLRAASDNVADINTPLVPTSLSGAQPYFETVQLGDVSLRVFTRPVTLSNGSVAFSVQIASSLATVNQAMDRLLTIMVIGMTLAVGGSVVVGLLIANQALKPIDDITRAASRITETDDLSTRLPWQGPMDELGRLTFVFNRMMDRLEHLFGVQQRFVADVSHELRTPLTAIRGNLELVERYGADETSIHAITDEVNRMARLVNDLLLLARADYGGVKLELDPLDLDTVVMSALREAKSIALARNAHLNVRLGRFEPVRINGNGDRMMQLLLNLVSNAIKFTPPGGEVKLTLSEEGEYAVVRVSDTGIGIAEEDIPLVFDRFYQAEASRANTEHDMGTGLGLSICKWIAEAHGGTIKVDSQVNHGTTFTVSIPRLAHTASTKTGITVTNEMRAMYRANKNGHHTHHAEKV